MVSHIETVEVKSGKGGERKVWSDIPMPLFALTPDPLISVVMPNHNYAEYLGRAIESVLQQSYGHFELVVCDDGSTDESCNVAGGYVQKDSRVVLIRKENGGHGSAVNRAFDHARGEIICFLDSDDLFETDKLESILTAFKKNADCGLAIHNMNVIDHEGKKIRTALYHESGHIGPEITTLRMGLPFPQSSGLSFKREVLQEILPLPEKEFRSAADWAIAYAAAYLTPAVLIPRCLGSYRIHGTNTSGTTSTATRLEMQSIEKTLDGINRVMSFVERFMREQYGLPVAAWRVRNRIEHRLILGLLRGDRALIEAAGNDLRKAFQTVRRDYPLHRYLFWNLLSMAPIAISKQALRLAFLGFRFSNDVRSRWGSENPLGNRGASQKTDRISRSQKSRVVTVIYKTLPKYRIPFFEALRPRLAEKGIDFHLIYGQPPADEAAKEDTGYLPWGQRIRNHIIPLGSRSLYWQPCLSLLKGADLVIVEQASKLLINYVLVAAQFFRGPKLAFWGHGKNFMIHQASFAGEALKRVVSRHVHWWFAYSERSAEVIRGLGFERGRITIVQNAIETSSLLQRRQKVSEEALALLREKIGLRGEHVAIYSGGLYREKRIDYLIRAGRIAKRYLPDFGLIILGAGPEASIVREEARESPWLHYAGPVFGEERVPFFMMSKIMLIPGAVGLGIIDSFSMEVPLMTIDLPGHGPEIEYLVHGENGVLLKGQVTEEDYARAMAALLRDKDLQKRLREGCREAARRYTLEEMLERFAGGVIQALNS
jgi:glycosyltransferase involved in cell wall biosynthesis